jgi:hypothetical protein
MSEKPKERPKRKRGRKKKKRLPLLTKKGLKLSSSFNLSDPYSIAVSIAVPISANWHARQAFRESREAQGSKR